MVYEQAVEGVGRRDTGDISRSQHQANLAAIVPFRSAKVARTFAERMATIRLHPDFRGVKRKEEPVKEVCGKYRHNLATRCIDSRPARQSGSAIAGNLKQRAAKQPQVPSGYVRPRK